MEMRAYLDIVNERIGKEPLPPDVIAAFTELGNLQRGEPEHAMLRVQHIMGGGVVSPTVEHAGDIIHRMSHMAAHDNPGQEYVHDKATKVLRWLSSGYGFEREMLENIKNNAEHAKSDPVQLKNAIFAALQTYSDAHAKLPVYNRTQWIAREIPMMIGKRRFERAKMLLRKLIEISERDDYKSMAFQYHRNPDGTLKSY